VGDVWVGFFRGLERDGGAVVGAADAACQVGTIVARIVPSEAAFVVRVLPKADGKLDRFDRLLAVERHRLAVGFDFFAAPRPQIWVPEARGIAEGVTERLAKRAALGLELFAGLAVFVPALREFAVAIPDFREPGFAISQQPTSSRPGHADPLLADSRDRLRDVVIGSLNLTDLRSNVADV